MLYALASHMAVLREAFIGAEKKRDKRLVEEHFEAAESGEEEEDASGSEAEESDSADEGHGRKQPAASNSPSTTAGIDSALNPNPQSLPYLKRRQALSWVGCRARRDGAASADAGSQESGRGRCLLAAGKPGGNPQCASCRTGGTECWWQRQVECQVLL